MTHTDTFRLTDSFFLTVDNCMCVCLCTFIPDVAYYKKRKVGRPSLGENAQDGDTTKPARRRKKRKAIFVQKKRRSSIVGYHTTESPQVCQTTWTQTKTHTQKLSIVTPETYSSMQACKCKRMLYKEYAWGTCTLNSKCCTKWQNHSQSQHFLCLINYYAKWVLGPIKYVVGGANNCAAKKKINK